MTIVYLFASILGALATSVALWSLEWPVALLCAPLGGSALTLTVASLVVRVQRAPSPLTASAA